MKALPANQCSPHNTFDDQALLIKMAGEKQMFDCGCSIGEGKMDILCKTHIEYYLEKRNG